MRSKKLRRSPRELFSFPVFNGFFNKNVWIWKISPIHGMFAWIQFIKMTISAEKQSDVFPAIYFSRLKKNLVNDVIRGLNSKLVMGRVTKTRFFLESSKKLVFDVEQGFSSFFLHVWNFSKFHLIYKWKNHQKINNSWVLRVVPDDPSLF